MPMGAGVEAGHGPTMVLSFGSPSGWRDQMTFCIGRREFITLSKRRGGVALRHARTTAGDAGDRFP